MAFGLATFQAKRVKIISTEKDPLSTKSPLKR